MKNVIIVLAIGLIGLGSLSAQPQGRGYKGVNLDEIPGITSDQKEKIEKIRTSQREEMQKLRSENRGQRGQIAEEQRESERKKVQALREKSDKEIEGILNAEQFDAYKQKRDAPRRQMRPGDQGRRGTPQANMHKGNHREQRHYTRQGRGQSPRRMHRHAPSSQCPCAAPAPANAVPAQQG